MPARKRAKKKASRGRKKSAARSRRRIRYTDQQRREILATAKREGLSATQVQKRFGVTRVTFYAWRKKTGMGRTAVRRGRGRRVGMGSKALDGLVAENLRQHVRAQIGAVLPEIVRAELDAYFSVGRKGRRK